MKDVRERVSRCFLNVFADLPADELARCSMASVSEWDSTAHVMLLSALEEEFGVQLELNDYEVLVSYALIVDYFESQNSNG